MLRHLFYCRKCNLNFFGEDVQLKCPKRKQFVEIENKIDARE